MQNVDITYSNDENSIILLLYRINEKAFFFFLIWYEN